MRFSSIFVSLLLGYSGHCLPSEKRSKWFGWGKHNTPGPPHGQTNETQAIDPPDLLKFPISGLPIIDLGYVQQRATFFNTSNSDNTVSYHIYKNVRFAAPPTGERRFQPPSPPLYDNSTRDGTEIQDSACHQFIPSFLPGIPWTGLEIGAEDCLFLDVYVPTSVNPDDSVPVLAWHHGGAFVIGSKDFYLFGNPEELMTRAVASGQPMIFVAMNYRLGSFGWLAPNDGSVTPNVGLYDFRAAMEWIKTYIGRFGGDPNRITSLGESAGAALIMHTLTGYGGARPDNIMPFQQAILQSAGWPIEPSSRQGRDNAYNLFEFVALCSSWIPFRRSKNLDCLRNASASTLYRANKILINLSLISSALGAIVPRVAFGPLVDDDLVPDRPPRLLEKGRLNNITSVVSANTRFEGRALTTRGLAKLQTLPVLIKQETLWQSTSLKRKELEALYPCDGTKDQEYNRVVDFYTDIGFACHSRALADAYSSTSSDGASKAYRLVSLLGNGKHGSDIQATFTGVPLDRSEVAARNQQSWIVDYVSTGSPSQNWPEYGKRKSAMWLNETIFGEEFDPWAVGNPVADERCEYFLERREYNK